MSTTLYGIKNCDTIKKARKWLDNQSIDYQFHDFRVDGLEEQLLDSWLEQLGWEGLINKRGTTWRQLSDEQKATMDNTLARAVILENPALIKRPVLINNEHIEVGFKEPTYQTIFAQ